MSRKLNIVAKVWAMRLISLLGIVLIPATYANAQSQTSENMRNLALRVSFSEATAQYLQSGDRIDLVWISHPELDQQGMEKQTTVSIIANNLVLTSIPEPNTWEEKETGFRAVATIMMDLSTIREIVAVHNDGYFVIARIPKCLIQN